MAIDQFSSPGALQASVTGTGMTLQDIVGGPKPIQSGGG